jgi:hypothetical protein
MTLYAILDTSEELTAEGTLTTVNLVDGISKYDRRLHIQHGNYYVRITLREWEERKAFQEWKRSKALKTL